MSNTGNERKEVIKMGYLVKSPSRSRDKSSYAIFWKVRWCVLVQMFSPDEGIAMDFPKFSLYYYEDEDSYKQDSTPKGMCFPLRKFFAYMIIRIFCFRKNNSILF